MDEDVIIEPDEEAEEGEGRSSLGATIARLRRERDQARKEKQENLDGWHRAKADYVNALKRFEEEEARALLRGQSRAVEAFLPPIDSLERAKASGELPAGFVGIVKQLEAAAKSVGLEQFGREGEHFNPSLHEALGQDPASSKQEDDTITTVLEPGWKMGDSILRPAKVRVAHFTQEH